ncbi:MAG: biotin--[acetyl-CoA-carboxylase] ligase [Actinobacteria bacterium]|nr:MAG: biotin--[acetyl-CoA-carboxylase] ligase [Actinomycetota bacterium]
MPVEDTPTRDAVVPRLRGHFGREYTYVESCPSTQRLLPPEAPEGAVAVADEQTEGRGRLGRRWEALAGTSILCSVQLRPAVDAAVFPELTVVGAEACAEAIRTVAGLEPALKHPNDVLIGSRKVAGVLGEAGEGRVVLGTGINANVPADELPVDVRIPATSLLAEAGREVDRIELLVEFLAALERRYDAWLETK